MLFTLHKGTPFLREEAQRKETGFGLLLLLMAMDIFPCPHKSHSQKHGEQDGKKPTERLPPEDQVCGGGFWLVSTPHTQLRMPSHQSGVEVGSSEKKLENFQNLKGQSECCTRLSFLRLAGICQTCGAVSSVH